MEGYTFDKEEFAGLFYEKYGSIIKTEVMQLMVEFARIASTKKSN